MPEKGHKGTFWGDGSSLYLERAESYMGALFIKTFQTVCLRLGCLKFTSLLKREGGREVGVARKEQYEGPSW